MGVGAAEIRWGGGGRGAGAAFGNLGEAELTDGEAKFAGKRRFFAGFWF